jgi:hypothetical protein
MQGSSNKNPRVQRRAQDRREKAAHIEELAHDRRGEVYKTDPALFTGTDIIRRKRVPKIGTPEREAFDAKILELVDAGKTHIQISEELDVYPAHITRLTRKRRTQ